MKKAVSKLLPLLGFLFIAAYIRSATVDVVYTDYMRLVNSYLPDVWSFKPYLHADILTRIPINYLERIINVKLFGYSTTFDMLLGALFFSISAALIAGWMSAKKTGSGYIVAVLLVFFSLDKWEMFTNGSGWVHFLFFAMLYYHFVVYDRVRNGKAKKGDNEKLLWLPSFTILLIAGPYTAIYAGTFTIVYTVDLILRKDRKNIGRLTALLIPTLLYILSRSASVEEYAGATDMSFMQVMTTQPMTVIAMVVKSFASMIIGGETAVQYGIPDAVLWILGLTVMAAYVVAVVVNFKSGLIKKTALPLLLIAAGLVSHGVVALGRWIFLDDMYGMSSRYALQFQSGIIGIILTFIMSRRAANADGRRANGCVKSQIAGAIFMALVIAGHLVTTGREIDLASARHDAFENMRFVALTYEEQDDATLKSVLQYSKPDMTRKALKILEDNNLNIFR